MGHKEILKLKVSQHQGIYRLHGVVLYIKTSSKGSRQFKHASSAENIYSSTLKKVGFLFSIFFSLQEFILLFYMYMCF